MSLFSSDLIRIASTNLGTDAMRASFISNSASFRIGATNVYGTFTSNVSIRANDGMVAVSKTGSAPTTITLADFPSGGNAVIGGLNAQDFALSYQDVASGALQVIATPGTGVAGAPTTVILPGYSTADLSNGRLSAGFATNAAGQSYLDINAN